MGEIEWELTTGKKCAVMKQLFVALQKKKKLCLSTIFAHFFSIFKTFIRSGKLLGKFQEFKTLFQPWA